MLSEKQYIESSEEFGTSVGIAHAISKRWLKGDELVNEFETKEDIQRYSEQNLINNIVLKCIEKDKYQELERTLYRLRREMGKRKVKDITIYRKAWYYIVNGHDKTNNTKSREILEEIG